MSHNKPFLKQSEHSVEKNSVTSDMMGKASSNCATVNSMQIDPEVLHLVNEFFNSQFALKGERIDVNSTVIPESTVDNATNEHRKVAASLRALGEAYIQLYQKQISSMVQTFDIQSSNALTTFNSISNVLFNEGIEWSHIVTYFVFSAEFAHYVNLKNIASTNDVAQWLALFISQHLLSWIKENEGWNGIVNFAQQTIGNSKPSDGKWNLDFKNILCGAAGALGVLSLGFFLSSK